MTTEPPDCVDTPNWWSRDRCTSRVVLAAGSLGGFTASLGCERVRVGELVLVSAMIPVPGETPREGWTRTGAFEVQK